VILKSFEYFEFPDDERYWAIKQFELGKVNLFAAKNATGKSRTLIAINSLNSIIQKSDFNTFSNYDNYDQLLKSGFIYIIGLQDLYNPQRKKNGIDDNRYRTNINVGLQQNIPTKIYFAVQETNVQ